MSADGRSCLARVFPETIDAWDAFCEEHLIDRTVLCDVIGVHLARGTLPPLEQLVREAADLKNQRRRRG